MQQIKLLKETFTGFQQTQNRINIEQVFDSPKRKYYQQQQTIEPWYQEAQSNPFINAKPKLLKKISSPKMKRQSSLGLTKQWSSMEKAPLVSRQTKKLAVLDVGQFNPIRKSIYLTKIKSKLDINSASLRKSERKQSTNKQFTLPSVQRQLSIERKIFLMKNLSQQQNSVNSSPTKSSKLRNFVNDIKS